MTAPVMLDVTGLAAHLGIAPRTVHTYLAKGILPEPDERIGNSPRWRLSTIRRWQQRRPGRGWRRGVQVAKRTTLRGTIRLVPRDPEMFRANGSVL